MVPRLQKWQWIVLTLPIATIISFLAIAAAFQIHLWGISWIWAIFTLVLVGWRWLLVRWTQPEMRQIEQVMAEVEKEIADVNESIVSGADQDKVKQIETVLQKSLKQSQDDLPLWQDLSTFSERSTALISGVAHIYRPDVKYPLLNIYVPQAYGLLRGTVDDLDRWIKQLSPVLNQVTIGQAYEAYEVYQKLEPRARKLLRAWNWLQWVINPASAVARRATFKYGDRANQQLLLNFNQLLREAALRNLCQQAVKLYGGQSLPLTEVVADQPLPTTKTQTLREIITVAEPSEQVELKPVNILLVGRTGAGKSSLINTLFDADKATVDVLPNTDQITLYSWLAASGEQLNLWDTPGYEQAEREDLRSQVLQAAVKADVVLLLTPALDPALQMDVDFLQDLTANVENLPTIAVVTQVDRLRPVREWSPPYDWQTGDRPKEKMIREAIFYRTEQLGEYCQTVLPAVMKNRNKHFPWGIDALSMALIEAIAPAKQLRLARFIQNQEACIVEAAKIIDRYTVQMATTQGLANFLKSPALEFIATLTTGTPTLAVLLAEKIPVEQLPTVIGKLQMAYDLYLLLQSDKPNNHAFDLLSLWPVLLDNQADPDRNAWAFGHALTEYWTQNLTTEQMAERFQSYL